MDGNGRWAKARGLERVSGHPDITQNRMPEKMSVMTMRIRFSVRLPMRLLPNSLNSAVAVHENATPIEISSPMYCMVAKVVIKWIYSIDNRE